MAVWPRHCAAELLTLSRLGHDCGKICATLLEELEDAKSICNLLDNHNLREQFWDFLDFVNPHILQDSCIDFHVQISRRLPAHTSFGQAKSE